jgi:acetoacetate decarboxylase
MLKGYTTPLSPNGRANLATAPPWHYAGSLLVIEFRAKVEAVRDVLPPGLVPSADPSRCVAFFADWQACSDSRVELLDPVRANYREFFVLVAARLGDQEVMTCPYIFVDQDVSLMRGLLQGFPKVMGSIHTTRSFNVSSSAAPELGPGGCFAGTVAAKDRRLVEAVIRIDRPSGEGPALAPIVNLRYFPRVGTAGGPLAAELVRSSWEDVRTSAVWAGSAEMQFLESPCHELHLLQPVEVGTGYRYDIALTIRAVEAVCDVSGRFASWAERTTPDA